MKKFPDVGLLVLRVVASGLMILEHGLPKAWAFERKFDSFPDPLGIGHSASYICATLSETLFPLLVLVGLFTRLASIPVTFTMMVAAFVVHAGDSLRDRESSLIYLAAFLAIALMGPGKFSIDHFRKGQ